MLVGLVLRTRNVQRHRAHDFWVKLNPGWRQSERLDRLVEHDLVAIDGEAAFADRSRDVACRNRTVKLTRIAGRPDNDERLAFELGGNGLSFFLVGQVVGFELCPAAFEHLLVFVRCAQRLLLRQKEVTGVAVLDVDDVAHLAKAADALKQNDLHGCVSFCVRGSGFQFRGLGGPPMAAR